MAVVEVVVTLEYLDEGGLEGAVEDGVDDWIDGGGDVTKPQAHVGQVVRHLTRGTRGEVDIEDEERRPAYDEGEENQTEDLGGFLLIGDSVGGQRVSLLRRQEPQMPRRCADQLQTKGLQLEVPGLTRDGLRSLRGLLALMDVGELIVRGVSVGVRAAVGCSGREGEGVRRLLRLPSH